MIFQFVLSNYFYYDLLSIYLFFNLYFFQYFNFKMRKSVKTDLQKYHDALASTQQVSSINKNFYNLSKRKSQKDNPNWPMQYHFKTIKNVQINDTLKKRLNKLRNIEPHDNIVPISAQGFNYKKKQVYILSEYFNGSINLSTFVQRKIEVSMSSLNRLFYQVVKAMVHLEQKKINHLRLCPSSILIKLPQNPKQYPVVRLCDLGIGREQKFEDKFCHHIQIFENKTNPYENQFQNNIRYDIWALGTLIYYTLKQRKPFYQRSMFVFSDKSQLKKQHIRNPQKWLLMEDNNFSRDFILEQIMIKCWGIYKQPLFSSWKQVLNYFDTRFKSTDMQVKPINQIFTNHFMFIFTLSNFYQMIRQEMKYKVTKLFRQPERTNKNYNDQIQQKMSKLCLCILKISMKFHGEFMNLFYNRCSILPYYKVKLLDLAIDCIQNQIEQFGKLQTGFQKQLQYFIKGVAQISIDLKDQILNLPYACHTISKIDMILKQIISCCAQYQKMELDNTKNKFQCMSCFYQSDYLRRISCQFFHFKLPKNTIYDQMN